MEDQLTIVKQKTTVMESMLDKFQVDDDKKLSVVSDKIKEIKVLQKFIEQEKDKLVKPAKSIITEAKEKYDPYIKKCQEGESILKGKAAEYMEAKDEKERIEKERLAKRVEKGTMKAETAVSKIEMMPENEKTVKTEKGSSLRMKKRRVAVIVNPQLIPQKYWMIDEVLVRREALAGVEIPGVEIQMKSSLSSF